jgi:hypothetical protein
MAASGKIARHREDRVRSIPSDPSLQNGGSVSARSISFASQEGPKTTPEEDANDVNASPGAGVHLGPGAASLDSMVVDASVHLDNKSNVSTAAMPPRLTLRSSTKVHPVHIPDTSTQQEYIPNTSDEDVDGTVSLSYDDRMTEHASVVVGGDDDQDISQEQLQMIKARTMFQMTEEIDDGGGGRKRLLFLTNTQAELLAGSSASIQKMLDALEIPKPKLVINLLPSQGFSDYIYSKGDGDSMDLCCADAGLVVGHSPFSTVDEENRANERLDHFMATVILPLAAQTQAVILCNAISCICAISSSLTRMLSVHGATWGKDAPFTVLSMTGDVQSLYANKSADAIWRSMRRSSRAWRQRDKKILELMYTKHNGKVSTRFWLPFSVRRH